MSQYLYLMLAGPIPKALGALRELEELWLGNNQLIGERHRAHVLFSQVSRDHSYLLSQPCNDGILCSKSGRL